MGESLDKTEIYKREYNTEVTQLLVSDAEIAVQRLKGYSEFKSYKSRLKQAKDFVSKLPTEIIIPEIPQDDEDNISINPDKYHDQEVDDLHDAEHELEEYNKKHNNE